MSKCWYCISWKFSISRLYDSSSRCASLTLRDECTASDEITSGNGSNRIARKRPMMSSARSTHSSYSRLQFWK